MHFIYELNIFHFSLKVRLKYIMIIKTGKKQYKKKIPCEFILLFSERVQLRVKKK